MGKKTTKKRTMENLKSPIMKKLIFAIKAIRKAIRRFNHRNRQRVMAGRYVTLAGNL